jgi:GTP-binding protein
LIRAYLAGRPSLLRVYLLVDGRHGIKKPDAETMDDLDRAAVSYQIVLTKRDEVKRSEQAGRIEETAKAIAKRPAAFPDVLFTSARNGEGIGDVRAAIAQVLAERGERAPRPHR